jgi:tRNA-uridine 2-sulfurtransferase
MTQIKALALFSGGLDSILAARLIMEQGIEVEAIQFVTPFFNYHLLDDTEGHTERIYRKYGIKVIVEDISPGYLQLLHNPAHGFGKNFNPCIDCKIFMFSRAKEMLGERGASFLITGEVLGQRPMSQRRDTLNVIERDSGTRSLLLRPLCAQQVVTVQRTRSFSPNIPGGALWDNRFSGAGGWLHPC